MATKKHVIVTLESMNLPLPSSFAPPPGVEHTYISYAFTSPDQLAERIQDATILITTTRPLTPDFLDPKVSPNLELIQLLGTGVDSLDIARAKARGIDVQNIPGANIQSVAEHAVSLFTTTRRSSVLLAMKVSMKGDWTKGALVKHMVDRTGAMPPGLHEEIACIIGFGGVGRYIAKIAKALGMKVCIAERADTALLSSSAPVVDGEPKFIEQEHLEKPHNAPRTPIKTAIKAATVIFLACPLLPTTAKLISNDALELMKPNAIIVNVARGPIVDEEALAKALKEHKIAGAASDVFEEEPSDSDNSPLVALDPSEVNFVASPHVAWFSGQTFDNLSEELVKCIEGWMRGETRNVVS